MVEFKQHIDIHKTVDEVWPLFGDVSRWAQWFGAIDAATGVDAVVQGETFEWSKAGKTGSGSIAHVDNVDSNRDLKLVFLGGDYPIHHDFVLHRGGFLGLNEGVTRLEYHLYYDPPGFIGDFVRGGNPLEAVQVKQTLEKIKQLVEHK